MCWAKEWWALTSRNAESSIIAYQHVDTEACYCFILVCMHMSHPSTLALQHVLPYVEHTSFWCLVSAYYFGFYPSHLLLKEMTILPLAKLLARSYLMVDVLARLQHQNHSWGWCSEVLVLVWFCTFGNLISIQGYGWLHSCKRLVTVLNCILHYAMAMCVFGNAFACCGLYWTKLMAVFGADWDMFLDSTFTWCHDD